MHESPGTRWRPTRGNAAPVPGVFLTVPDRSGASPPFLRDSDCAYACSTATVFGPTVRLLSGRYCKGEVWIEAGAGERGQHDRTFGFTDGCVAGDASRAGS